MHYMLPKKGTRVSSSSSDKAEYVSAGGSMTQSDELFGLEVCLHSRSLPPTTTDNNKGRCAHKHANTVRFVAHTCTGCTHAHTGTDSQPFTASYNRWQQQGQMRTQTCQHCALCGTHMHWVHTRAHRDWLTAIHYQLQPLTTTRANAHTNMPTRCALWHTHALGAHTRTREPTGSLSRW